MEFIVSFPETIVASYFIIVPAYPTPQPVFSEVKNIVAPAYSSKELKESLEDSNCISVFLRLHPLLNQEVIAGGAVLDNGTTLAIKLDTSYLDIYSKYSSGHKYDLKKSKTDILW